MQVELSNGYHFRKEEEHAELLHNESRIESSTPVVFEELAIRSDLACLNPHAETISSAAI